MNVIDRVRNVPEALAGTLAKMRRSLLWMLLARQRRVVRWTIALVFMSTVWNLQITNATVAMIDNAIVDQAMPVGPYVSQIIGLSVVAFIVGFASKQLSARLGYQVEFDLRMWLYTRVQWADLRKLDQVAAGQLITRSMTDLQQIESILRYLPTIITLVPITLALLLYLAILSPPLALIAASALPLNLWLLTKFRTRLWALSWAELNERAEVARAVDEPVRGVRVMQAFGREEHERVRLQQTALKAFRYAMTRVRLLARYDVFLKAVPITVNALVLVVGARLIVADVLSVGVFVVAFGVAGGVTQIALVFGELASAWQYLRGAQSRISEILALGERPQDGREPSADFGGVELRGAAAAFAGVSVFEDLSFAARPGELVVVAGPPGSGKTTLAGLVGGLVQPAAGEVLLDGRPLHDLDITTIRMLVRVVSEEPVLFSGTLRQNLDLGASWAVSDEEMHAALHAAGADDIVQDLPEGLDTHVGDRGLTLSGGQRQRLALARALVAKPRILVLDDALSAVNPSHEVGILRRLQTFLPQSAIVCISRRPGPAQIATSRVDLPARAPVAATETSESAMPELAAGSELMQTVASLQLTDEEPSIRDEDCRVDEMPTVRRLVRLTLLAVSGVFVLTIVNATTGLGPELLFSGATDAAEDENIRRADLIGLGVVVVGVFFALSGYWLRVVAMKVAQSMVYLLRRRIFLRLTKLGIDYYDRELPGEVAARVVNDLDTVLTFVAERLYRFIAEIGKFVVGVTIIAVLIPDLAPTVTAIVVAIVVFTVVQLAIGLRAYDRVRDDLGRVVATFEEHFFGRSELRGCGALTKANNRFVEEAWQLRQSRRWATSVGNVYAELLQVVNIIGGALILGNAADPVLAGTVAVGAVLSARLIVERAGLPLTYISEIYIRLLEAKVSWDRLKEPFETPILPVDRTDAVDAPPLRGDITFDRVGFSYPGTNRVVLHDVTFTIPAGKVAALVGFTGAGKSSITKLLTRTYDPTDGAVLVDGVDIRNSRVKSYRARLGVVPQDAFLFKGTVRSNISYSRPDASLEDIIDAATAVGAHAVLAALEDGYDHPVEEEGRNLTAGQRQLIALARVWLAKPDVLILDEATSSLDGPLEDGVLDAVAKLGVTTLAVTHRDNVARRSDLTIVIEAGRIVESGTPTELIGAGSAYDRLWVIDDDELLVGATTGGRRRTAGRPRRVLRASPVAKRSANNQHDAH